jgi:hypothetical protein
MSLKNTCTSWNKRPASKLALDYLLTYAYSAAMPEIKSMALFYIDNRQAWPESAILLQNLVIWPDDGVYPTSTPVAIAGHPNFDGKILVQAGNRALVVTLIEGAQTQNDVREGLKHKPEQYRIALDAIVHAIMLMRADAAGEVRTKHPDGDVHAFTLLNLLKDKPEGALIRDALGQYMKNYPTHAQPTVYERLEEMYQALEPTPAPEAPAP